LVVAGQQQGWRVRFVLKVEAALVRQEEAEVEKL
jgi:hypothetical protein